MPPQDQKNQETPAKPAEKLAAPALKFTKEQIGNSRMLDSTGMEAEHEVNKLTHRPDGTTVVRYYFSEDPEAANRLCMNNAEVQFACTVSNDEFARKLVRDTMKAVTTESGAKIAFEATDSPKNADITFVKPNGAVNWANAESLLAYAGAAGDKSFIAYSPDRLPLDMFRQQIEQRMTQYTPEQRDTARKKMTEMYGSYENAISGMYELEQKRLIAHEIEHRLGAKHPYILMADEPGSKQVTLNSDPQTFLQSIMGLPVAENDKTLGTLDVVWYQRHFGAADLPQGDLQKPSPTPDKPADPVIKKER